MDQGAVEPVDQDRAHHVGSAGGIAGDPFLIDDVGAEGDAIGDVVVKVRMLRHRSTSWAW